MKLMVFSLRDVKAGVFGRPVFTASFGTLVRELTDAVNEREGMLGKHPEDFHLYRLGDFDDEKGLFDLLQLPDMVLDCSTLVALSAPRAPGGEAAQVQ